MMNRNGGLAAGVFNLSASVECSKGHKVLVSHVSNGNRFVIVRTMGFGGTWAGGRDNITVV